MKYVIFVIMVMASAVYSQTPSVISVSPTQGGENVTVRSSIVVTFDSDMNASTINNSTFVVHSQSIGVVEGTITYYESSKTAVFDPTADFDFGDVITIILTTGIRSLGGQYLENGFIWSFTTMVINGSCDFEPQVVFGAGTEPRAVSSADFDLDGDPDLAVGLNVYDGDILLFSGNGDGTFNLQGSYSAHGARYIICADMNNDGFPDIIAANAGASVLLNNGDGTFGPETYYEAVGASFSVFVNDFDGDSYMDIAVTNYGYNVVSVFFNNGDGTFGQRTDYDTGSLISAIGVCGADFDNDSDIDLAVGGLGPVTIFKNDGNGSFFIDSALSISGLVGDIAAGDFDRDGDIDMAAGSRVTDGMHFQALVPIMLNNGDGVFELYANYNAGDHYSSDHILIEVGDLDADSDLDIAVIKHGEYDSNYVTVFPNNGDATFAPYFGYAVGDESRSICFADLNCDGSLDIATANESSNDVSILFNINRPWITEISPGPNEQNVGTSTDLFITFDTDMDGTTINESTFRAFGSLTGNHTGTINYAGFALQATLNPDADFAAGETVMAILTNDILPVAGGPSLFANGYGWTFMTDVTGGIGTFGIEMVCAAGDRPFSISAADFDGDGDFDLANVNRYSDNISVFLNDGNGEFSLSSFYDVEDNPYAIISYDFNADNFPDLAAVNYSSFTVSVLLNDGDGTFALQTTYPDVHNPASICAADIDCDGNIDLAVPELGAHRVSTFINNGDGTFASGSTFAVGNRPRSIVAGDFDLNGTMDLATANSYSHDISVLLNYGDGIFSTQSTFPVGEYPDGICAADFDNDFELDIATANSGSNNVSVLKNHGGGNFILHQEYPVGSSPSSILANDVDGDNDIDLIIANDGSNDISVLLNLGAGSFIPATNYAAGSGPASLCAADFDSDGDIDIAVSNEDSDSVSILLNKVLYVCGDANSDETVNILDITYLIAYLYKGGPAPDPLAAADVNSDAAVNILDITYLIAFLYKSGPAPVCP